MDLAKKINKYASMFEPKQRGDETITIFAGNATEELKDAVRKAHGDRMPNDWIFEKFSRILETLRGYTIDNMDDVEDNRSEIVDGLVDVYTSDLTAWLNSHNANVYYITESQEEHGAQTDGFQILSMAQYKAIDDIFGSVVELLEGNQSR